MIEDVRPATEDDLDPLIDLYRAGADEMTTIKAAWAQLDGRVEPAADSFRHDIGDPQTLVLIGQIDEAAVGYVVAQLIDRLPQAGGLHALVREIYVDPEARAIGLGEELINAVIAWASEHGAKSAEIRVLPGHRSAKNFCEENGFTARLLLMHKDL